MSPHCHPHCRRQVPKPSQAFPTCRGRSPCLALRRQRPYRPAASRGPPLTQTNRGQTLGRQGGYCQLIELEIPRPSCDRTARLAFPSLSGLEEQTISVLGAEEHGPALCVPQHPSQRSARALAGQGCGHSPDRCPMARSQPTIGRPVLGAAPPGLRQLRQRRSHRGMHPRFAPACHQWQPPQQHQQLDRWQRQQQAYRQQP